MENNKINCRNCMHFYITWDTRFPYGCKSFGFKTKSMPSISVYQSSGKDCMSFTPKKKV